MIPKRKRWLLVVMLSMLIVGPLTVMAQDDNRMLSPNQPVTGVLSDDLTLQEWQFVGHANIPLSFRVRTLDGDLNPVLAIVNEAGEVLAANDDAAFGDPAPRIEGFIPPDDGVYTARVYREGLDQGSTTGRYELLMLEGYGSIPVSRSDGQRLWLNSADMEQNVVLPPLPDGNFMLTANVTIRQMGTTPYRVEWTIREPLTEDNPPAGWRFGWSSNGFWELEAIDSSGETLAMIDGAHDLLATPDISLQIAFILRADTLSVAINQEPVGDLTLPEDAPVSTSPRSSLRFFIETEPDAPLSMIYDAVTVNGIYYESDPAAVAIPPTEPGNRLYAYNGTPQQIIAELAERGVIPTDGGGIYAQISEGFVYTNDAGFSAYPLLGDNEYGDFVLVYTARLTEGPPDTACGLIFRQADGANFATALFTPNRDMYFLNYADGQIAADGVAVAAPYLEPGLFAPHRFVLVAIGDKGHVYANGRLVGTIDLTADTGRLLAHVVLNDDDANAYCLLTDIWLWQFEPAS